MRYDNAIKLMHEDFSRLNKDLTKLGNLLNERPHLDSQRVYFTLCMQREKLADVIGEVETYDEQGDYAHATGGIRGYWEHERPYFMGLVSRIGQNLGLFCHE